MVLKILKYAAGGILALLVILLVVLQVGSWVSMDRELTHTTASEDLPQFTQTSGTGLVNISANNMTFRARIAGFDGDLDKPVMILLHGFPVTSAMWLGLIEPLADSGLRVVAFDQRGYSTGARPGAVEAYEIGNLTSDVFAVADAVGAERFHLAGHDWGAAVGWATVMTRPDRVISWTGLSIAHPEAFQQALANDPDQQARSGYFAFFRTPWLPETAFTFNDLALLRGLYFGMGPEKTDEYIGVFKEPGALEAGLNWYRAMAQGPGEVDASTTDVSTPTLFIWGNEDQAVGRAAIDAMSEFMKGPYRNVELNAGHWMMVDDQPRIVEEVVAHVSHHR